MSQIFKTWRHVFKLDPDRELTDEQLEAVCLSGSDAILVGGSSGVTYDNTVDLMSRIRRYELPCAQEVSTLDSVVPGFDLYLIPMVLNTNRAEWIVGHHRAGLESYGELIPWDMLAAEGYIVLNPDSAVARLTGADSGIDAGAAAACARLADKLMRLPIVYVEYSGTYGDLDLVREVRRVTDEASVFYGGGVRDYATALAAAEVADTVVVGNIVYDDLPAALDTVRGVRDAKLSE
ncbi:geranylgeranylglyceryl/heptaprenylglyceryl phosphate synthase [Saccharibacillus sp. O23]|uniref:heptaprenylglyceryl phosphate synthase n=1 Tax=Saccharibacillus sp. O23 TaxID=2009338 RepID=UPI000B4E6957|nr:heptaprenylglyceryl phosphate synthase [Saccharibacillus sp. O23]OWR27534.1 geranylgeranylglyceryl/heptaprenylglyceryl phosphate synthase [Saccharibacillus sp. O23]